MIAMIKRDIVRTNHTGSLSRKYFSSRYYSQIQPFGLRMDIVHGLISLFPCGGLAQLPVQDEPVDSNRDTGEP
jgi:hypothetical protein